MSTRDIVTRDNLGGTVGLTPSGDLQVNLDPNPDNLINVMSDKLYVSPDDIRTYSTHVVISKKSYDMIAETKGIAVHMTEFFNKDALVKVRGKVRAHVHLPLRCDRLSTVWGGVYVGLTAKLIKSDGSEHIIVFLTRGYDGSMNYDTFDNIFSVDDDWYFDPTLYDIGLDEGYSIGFAPIIRPYDKGEGKFNYYYINKSHSLDTYVYPEIEYEKYKGISNAYARVEITELSDNSTIREVKI